MVDYTYVKQLPMSEWPEDMCKQQRMLNLSKDALAAILLGVPLAVVIVNRDGDILSLNDEMEHLSGYHRLEIIGKPLEILVPDTHKEAHAGYREIYCEHPIPREMGIGVPLKLLRKSGVAVPVDIHLISVTGTEGLLVAAAVREIRLSTTT